MPCQQIRMEDGTVVLANLKRGQTLTAADKQTLAEYVQFCRDRRAKEQRRRNAKLLPGAKR